MHEVIIYPPNSPIIGYIFNYPVRFYGVIMASVFFVGILGAYLLLKKRQDTKEAQFFLDYSPTVIFLSILGARLFYVLGSIKFYISNPSEIIMINHGGMSIYGAIFAGLITLYWLSKIKNFSFLKHLDVIAVIFPLCQAIGRLGNYFNQEAFGAPSNSFFKLYVSEAFRPEKYANVSYFHPTFLYEGMIDFLMFVGLLLLYIKNPNIKTGTISCIYLILYSITRFLIEGIRIDSVLNVFNMPIAQVISLFVLLVSIICLIILHKKKPHTN